MSNMCPSWLGDTVLYCTLHVHLHEWYFQTLRPRCWLDDQIGDSLNSSDTIIATNWPCKSVWWEWPILAPRYQSTPYRLTIWTNNRSCKAVLQRSTYQCQAVVQWLPTASLSGTTWRCLAGQLLQRQQHGVNMMRQYLTDTGQLYITLHVIL